jgi:predicted nucleotide-binding protein/DNA-binding PadR family transcriptional regulator
MEYDDDLIRSILEALEKVEPDHVEHHSKILPDYEDQEKVRKHVLHCRNEGWVEFKDVSTRDNFQYMFVRIIKPGREYLKKLKSNKVENKKGVDENKKADPKKVYVVHGRNEKAREGMFDFLRSIGLDPIEWNQAIISTGKASPFIGEVLDKAFEVAQAVIVLITGDDIAKLKDHYVKEDDPDYEKKPTPQARPNVLFEAGLAFGRCSDRTVLVFLEKETTRPFSDISGRHIIKLSNTPESRLDLKDRLQTAGCKIDIEGKKNWLKTGDFEGVIDRNLAKYELPEVKLPKEEKEFELNEDQLFILALIAESDEDSINFLFISYKKQFPEANLVEIKYIANLLEKNGLIQCTGNVGGNLLYVATDKGIERVRKESEIMKKYGKAIEEHKEMSEKANRF